MSNAGASVWVILGIACDSLSLVRYWAVFDSRVAAPGCHAFFSQLGSPADGGRYQRL